MHRWCQIIPAAAAVDKYYHLHHHGHPFHSLPRSTFLFTPPRSARPLIYYTDMSQNTQSAKTHTRLLSHLMYITLLHTTQHISTHSPAQHTMHNAHIIYWHWAPQEASWDGLCLKNFHSVVVWLGLPNCRWRVKNCPFNSLTKEDESNFSRPDIRKTLPRDC